MFQLFSMYGMKELIFSTFSFGTTSSDWLESSIKDVNEKTLLGVNKSYNREFEHLTPPNSIIEFDHQTTNHTVYVTV